MRATAKVRILSRAFDLVNYLKEKDRLAKEYPPNLAVYCPICEGQNKLWVLTEDKADGTEAGSWICYKCDAGGSDVLSLIRHVEDCDRLDALKILVERARDYRKDNNLRELVMDTLYGLDGVHMPRQWETEPLIPTELPDGFVFYEGQPVAEPYFESRGISVERAEKYGLGYCRRGFFENRLIVPVVFDGKVVFFVARWMGKKPPKGIKKVIYPKGSNVKRVLFNYDRAKHYERVVLVEDVFSAMHLGRWRENGHCVATFGTSLSPYQLELLVASSAREIILMWDHDAIDKARALAHRLSEFWTVRVVELPDDRDPDQHPVRDLRRMIAQAKIYDSRDIFREDVEERLL